MTVEPLDPAFVSEALSQKPWLGIDGVINARDLGNLPIAGDPSKITKPYMLLRTAELSGITPRGAQKLRNLNVTTVFDLRSDTEMIKYKAPIPRIEGIEIIRAPVFQLEDYSPEAISRRWNLYARGNVEDFMELYSQILDAAGPAFGMIMRHVRDNPEKGIIFHCTAGKDRTGVLAAIFLKLAGVSDHLICEDYALSRIGREPAREKILARLSQEPIFQSNSEAASSMFACRSETMLAMLELLEEKYGGVGAYCRNYLGLLDSDLATIRQNILIDV